MLGSIYRDPISGFVGTATALLESLTAASQVKLEADTGPVADGKERWFEIARVLPVTESSAPGFGS